MKRHTVGRFFIRLSRGKPQSKTGVNGRMLNHQFCYFPCLQGVKNMKEKLGIFLVCVCLLSGASYVDAKSGLWSVELQAVGQNSGGVSAYAVTIGVGEKNEVLDAPPPPPEYSVKMELIGPEQNAVMKDIRATGQSSYLWIIEIDPRGNIMPPGPRAAVISWDPSTLGPGEYELRAGYDGSGGIVIPDMKASDSVTVKGSGILYYTVIYTPDISE